MQPLQELPGFLSGDVGSQQEPLCTGPEEMLSVGQVVPVLVRRAPQQQDGATLLGHVLCPADDFRPVEVEGRDQHPHAQAGLLLG